MGKGNAIPADRVTILFLVMLVAAAGNTAMQSALPAIASQLKIADVWVSLAFSWSALLWVLTAPKWARQSDKRGQAIPEGSIEEAMAGQARHDVRRLPARNHVRIAR